MQLPGWIEVLNPGNTVLLSDLLAEFDAIFISGCCPAATPFSPSIEGHSDGDRLTHPKSIAPGAPCIDHVLGARRNSGRTKVSHAMGPIHQRIDVCQDFEVGHWDSLAELRMACRAAFRNGSISRHIAGA